MQAEPTSAACALRLGQIHEADRPCDILSCPAPLVLCVLTQGIEEAADAILHSTCKM